MKAPTLALALAATAFAGSSIYLWMQLQESRARADQVLAASRGLEARIAEFEKARAVMMERRMTAGGAAAGGALAQGAPPPPGHAEDGAPEQNPFHAPWPERTPAMERIMRAQSRSNIRRLYADLGPALGLGKDQANALIDLLADQQTRQFTQFHPGDDADQMRRQGEEQQRRNQREIAELVGADKAQALEEYQKTLPARMEVDTLASQFDGADAPLTDDQRKRLLDVLVAEQARVPRPEWTAETEGQDFARLQLEWQADYNQRVASATTGIFNSTQQSAFDDFQQWQKDMAQHFSAAANVVFAAPAGAAVMVAPAAPPPDRKQKTQ